MTPISIVKLFGLKAVPYVMATIGALALISMLRDANLLSEGALLKLLLSRYDDFLNLVLGPFEPLMIDLLQPYWPGKDSLEPPPFWRHGFAFGAMAAIGFAAPFYRRGSIFASILIGALGLTIAAAAAIAVDQFAPESAEARLGLAGAVVALGVLALWSGFGRAQGESAAGHAFLPSWRDERAASNVGWTIFGGLLATAMLIGLDASPYSEAIAAWLWFI